MTVIIATKDEQGTVIMGGDRRASEASGTYQTIPFPKVIERNGILMGFAGDAAVATLVMHTFNPPKPKKNQDVAKFVYVDFFNKLIKDLGNRITGSTVVLVAMEGRIFKIALSEGSSGMLGGSGKSSVSEMSFPCAVGCGDHLALGALVALEKMMPLEEAIKEAVNAASEHSYGCGGTPDVVSTVMGAVKTQEPKPKLVVKKPVIKKKVSKKMIKLEVGKSYLDESGNKLKIVRISDSIHGDMQIIPTKEDDPQYTIVHVLLVSVVALVVTLLLF